MLLCFDFGCWVWVLGMVLVSCGGLLVVFVLLINGALCVFRIVGWGCHFACFVVCCLLGYCVVLIVACWEVCVWGLVWGLNVGGLWRWLVWFGFGWCVWTDGFGALRFGLMMALVVQLGYSGWVFVCWCC